MDKTIITLITPPQAQHLRKKNVFYCDHCTAEDVHPPLAGRAHTDNDNNGNGDIENDNNGNADIENDNNGNDVVGEDGPQSDVITYNCTFVSG